MVLIEKHFGMGIGMANQLELNSVYAMGNNLIEGGGGEWEWEGQLGSDSSASMLAVAPSV